MSKETGGVEVPPGYRLVPEESTEQMNVAGCMAMRGNWGASDVYDAMLSAAPAPTDSGRGKAQEPIQQSWEGYLHSVDRDSGREG